MQIAYVHSGYWPSNSPSTTFVTYNALGMCSHFEEVHLFVRKGENLSSEVIFRKFFSVEKPPNLHVHAYSSRLHISHSFYFLQVLWYLFRHRKNLKTVISRNTTFLPYLSFLKKNFKIRTFYETHNFFLDLKIKDNKVTAITKREQRLEKRYLKNLSGIFCLLNEQKNLYSKYVSGVPIYLLRTGIASICQDVSKKKYLCYVGSFDKHKGIEDTIEAAALSVTKPPLLFIGGKNQTEIEWVKNLAEKFNYPQIIVTGWINKEKMAAYLEQVKVGIVPLTDTFFNRYLTSPLKIFDYYSYGIPVIASDFPSTRELIEENKTGLFFEAGNTALLSKRIDSLFACADYETLRKNVFDKAKFLLWTKRAELLKEILEGQHE